MVSTNCAGVAPAVTGRAAKFSATPVRFEPHITRVSTDWWPIVWGTTSKVMNISLGIVGNPGVSASQRAKGIAQSITYHRGCSGCNDGLPHSAGAREVDDPRTRGSWRSLRRLGLQHQLTDYTSTGFHRPRVPLRVLKRLQPDVMARAVRLLITPPSCRWTATPATVSRLDQLPNDYYNIEGTSMAAPIRYRLSRRW